MVKASGTPTHREDEGTAEQLQRHVEACLASGGHLVEIQIDLLGFAKRGAAAASAERAEQRRHMQRFHDFFESRLSPEDLMDMLQGIAMCVPQSCRGSMEMLPKLAVTYFTCATGSCNTEDLAEPILGVDLNASFWTDEPSSDESQQPTAGSSEPGTSEPEGSEHIISEAVDRCVTDSTLSLQNHGSHYGVGLIPSYMCYGIEEEIRRLVIPNFRDCRRAGGRMVLMQLDIHRYIQRRSGPEGTMMEPAAHEAFAKLAEFFQEETVVEERATRSFAEGFGSCLPASCVTKGARAAMPVVALTLIVRSADMSYEEASHLPDPRLGLELNVTGWSSAIFAGKLTRSCLPPEESILRAVVEDGWEEEGGLNRNWGLDGLQEEELADSEEELPLLKGTGFKIPVWMSCAGPPVRAEWQQFARLARTTFFSRAPFNLSWALRQAADRLIEEDWSLAQTFADWVADKSESQCRKVFVHFDEMTLRSSQDFTPFQYMLSMGDWRWRTLPEWKENGAFCPYGYVVALYVRARTLSSAGMVTSAVSDLELARKMTGYCSELDLLDEKIWGIKTLDIEMELLRLTFPAKEFNLSAPLLSASPTSRQGEWGLKQVWPEPLPSWQPVAHHALQLNTLVRLWVRSAAAKAEAEATVSPALALLAMPPYLCLFLVPMLLRIWGDSLNLSLFYLGPWKGAEKCEECMQLYRERFTRENPLLQDLPMKRGSTKGAFEIAWSDDFSYNEFLVRFRYFLESDPHARAAEVLLCTSPIWLCAHMRMMATKPVLALDLPAFSFSHPRSWSAYPKKWWSQLDSTMLFSQGLFDGPPLRGMLVREDMMRGYHWIAHDEPGHAHPFVACLSLYVKARYQCRVDPRVLVMRAGSLYRFAPTIRGRLFFATLLQFETFSSPWRFRLMHESSERLPYEELAAHRAAVWVPLNMASKMTLKDLQTMEIPTFVPDRVLQASISSRQAGKTCISQALTQKSWAYLMCREEGINFWLPISPLFRDPNLMHFSSVTDLVMQLSNLDCDRLEAISGRMRRWNEVAIADDANFWRDTILALKYWSETGYDSKEAADDARSSKMAPAIKYRGMPLMESMRNWSDAPWTDPCKDGTFNCSAETTCGPFGAHCAFREGIFKLACCAEASMFQHGLVHPHPLPSSDDPGAGEAGCLTDMSLCSEDMLQYGLHMLHKLPPRDDEAR